MKPRVILIAVLASCWVSLPARAGYLRWTMIEIGTGDVNYIKLPNGKDVIIDGGKPNDGKDVVVPFLQSLEGFDGVIDYMVATHNDADHFGGLEELLKSFEVRKVYSPTTGDPTGYFHDHFAVPVVSEGCPWVVKGAADPEASGGATPGAFDTGCFLSWDPDVTVRCLSVGSSGTTNRDSVVLALRFGSSSFIFTGDLSGDAVVNATLADYGGDVPADFHKVAHHGSVSDGANSAAWINQVHSVHPGYAFISCIGSAFHPTTECLDRLMANSTSIYMTFLDGNITVKADNSGNYSVVRQKIWDGLFDDRNPTTRAAYPPALPSGLMISSHTAQSVILDWDDVTMDSQGGAIPAEHVRYDVFRSTRDGGDAGGGADVLPGMSEACGIYEKITPYPVPGSNYTDTSVSPGKSYFYRVSAVRTDYYYERRYSNQVSASAGAPTLDSGDYNGDGTDEMAVFRGTYGMWCVRGMTRVYFGGSGDQPVPGDFNGDGTSEFAVFRGYYGLWSIRGLSRFYCGVSDDLPVPADYDGDQDVDPGLFRSSSGLWAVRNMTRLYCGVAGDMAVPGDFNGDGTREPAIFRPSTGLWTARGVTRLYFGVSSDTPVHGEYNGDGFGDAAIYRSSSGLWSIRGVTRIYFGGSSDQPVPADFNGDSRDETGIFRDSSGLWAVRDLTRLYFGATGDIPVTR
jgi:beta-lactamase superfamily II metal-dependent hydrolase